MSGVYHCKLLFLVCFLTVMQGTLIFNHEAHSQDPAAQPELEQILQKLETDSALERREARADLAAYVEKTDEEARLNQIQILIKSLEDESSGDRLKLGICDALSRLNFFWTSTDQDSAEKTLYKLYQKENDSALKKMLDRALMRANGLYYDALQDYNENVVDKTVEEKFRRVIEVYPSSEYAPQARFYLGRYLTRSYFILEEEGKNPNLEDRINKSNQILQEFITASSREGSASAHLLEAHFFRALNFVLMNQREEAIQELEHIENTQSSEEAIYVSQFCSYEGQKYSVDDSYDAKKLAEKTRTYLKDHGDTDFRESARHRCAFIDHLNSIR